MGGGKCIQDDPNNEECSLTVQGNTQDNTPARIIVRGVFLESNDPGENGDLDSSIYALLSTGVCLHYVRHCVQHSTRWGENQRRKSSEACYFILNPTYLTIKESADILDIIYNNDQHLD